VPVSIVFATGVATLGGSIFVAECQFEMLVGLILKN